MLRLPEPQAQKASEHLRRSHNGPVAPEDLELAGFLMLLTTAARHRLSTDAAIDLYPLRWLGELQHRRNKFLGGLERLPDFLPQTINTWILGLLLAEYLLQKLAASTEPSTRERIPDSIRSAARASQPVSPAFPGLGSIPPFAQHPWHLSALLWVLLAQLFPQSSNVPTEPFRSLIPCRAPLPR